MVDLKSQKTIASRILKCGRSRVRLDPAKIGEITEAITAADIRKLIKNGVIWAKPKIGLSNFRKKKVAAQKKKGRRKGIGSRKGNKALKRKHSWMGRVRALRKMLKELKTTGQVDLATHRNLYNKTKGGFFRSRGHLKIYLERNNLLKNGAEHEKKTE